MDAGLLSQGQGMGEAVSSKLWVGPGLNFRSDTLGEDVLSDGTKPIVLALRLVTGCSTEFGVVAGPCWKVLKHLKFEPLNNKPQTGTRSCEKMVSKMRKIKM
uniref:Uncharacterized protein n=1 Tax=Callorhinchus milii TaxID=7868 RepID=A0A4W3JZT0_CALMI